MTIWIAQIEKDLLEKLMQETLSEQEICYLFYLPI